MSAAPLSAVKVGDLVTILDGRGEPMRVVPIEEADVLTFRAGGTAYRRADGRRKGARGNGCAEVRPAGSTDAEVCGLQDRYWTLREQARWLPDEMRLSRERATRAEEDLARARAKLADVEVQAANAPAELATVEARLVALGVRL